MEIRDIPIQSIKIDRYNPRVDLKQHDKEYKDIVASIRKFGLVEPLVVNHDMTLIGGHQRLKIMRDVFAAEAVPCVVVALDKRREKALNVALNKITGRWDYNLLRDVIAEIRDDVIDLGFSGRELDKLFEPPREDDDPEDDVLYSSRVLTLKDDVKFPSTNKLGFPDILPDKALLCDAPEIYDPYQPTDANVLWNFGSDSTKHLQWPKCVVGFYVEDYRFERIWTDTRKYVTEFINHGVLGCVSPNFSAYYDHPAAIRIYNIFRSRWVARYMQEAGLPVVLDISGAPEDADWAFLGIPKGFPICFQIHREQKKTAEKKNAFLAAAISAIDPEQIWCYGQPEKSEWYPALAGADVKYITPRTVRMRRRIDG